MTARRPPAYTALPPMPLGELPMMKALLAADQSKDEFLALVAHELRSPLAPILAAVQLLQVKGPADPAVQKLRDTILRQTLHLSRLVDDLLDVGGIISGKLRLDRVVADLNTIVKQAIEMCVPTIERRHQTLNTVLGRSALYVDIDAARTVQVVCNLLNNAAKYTQEGGRIELTVAERGRDAVICVRDDGIGIPPDMLGRIFQRFVQVDSSTHRAHGGLGIGLAVVKAVVDLHGGTVEARSGGIGTGSEFTVSLPRRLSRLGATRGEEHAMLQDTLADLRLFAAGSSPRLFIVGDVSSQLRNAVLDEVWSVDGRDACRPQGTTPFHLPTDSTSRLIIDDVEALSPDDQQALLHWLDCHVEAMVLSFAARTVFPLVTNGIFLEELFYRLNIVTVTIDGPAV